MRAQLHKLIRIWCLVLVILLGLEIWNLVFHWSLDLGVWIFAPPFPLLPSVPISVFSYSLVRPSGKISPLRNNSNIVSPVYKSSEAGPGDFVHNWSSLPSHVRECDSRRPVFSREVCKPVRACPDSGPGPLLGFGVRFPTGLRICYSFSLREKVSPCLTGGLGFFQPPSFCLFLIRDHPRSSVVNVFAIHFFALSCVLRASAFKISVD